MKRTILPLLLFPLSLTAHAAPGLSLKPCGRFLMDGALYASPQKQIFPDGVAIPEARLGVKMQYGRWSSTIDVGYAYAKVGLRNMWAEYDINGQSEIRFGNFIHQYGLQSTSQSLKITMEQPIASAPFTPGIQLGAMYVRHTQSLYTAASLHAENSALTQAMNYPQFIRQGYGALARAVWHKSVPGQSAMHLGLSGGFATPQRRLEDNEDIHDGFSVSANFPTKVTLRQALGSTVSESRNLFKFTPEVVAAFGPLAFEGQYFFQQINRRNGLKPYVAQSGYATFRAVLFGDDYSYSNASAQLAAPKSNALEIVADYNYTSLSDSSAGISGGRANSVSATLNWYINPYVTARLNYSHTHTWDRGAIPSETLNVFQARLMLLF